MENKKITQSEINRIREKLLIVDTYERNAGHYKCLNRAFGRIKNLWIAYIPLIIISVALFISTIVFFCYGNELIGMCSLFAFVFTLGLLILLKVTNGFEKLWIKLQLPVDNSEITKGRVEALKKELNETFILYKIYDGTLQEKFNQLINSYDITEK